MYVKSVKKAIYYDRIMARCFSKLRLILCLVSDIINTNDSFMYNETYD